MPTVMPYTPGGSARSYVHFVLRKQSVEEGVVEVVCSVTNGIGLPSSCRGRRKSQGRLLVRPAHREDRDDNETHHESQDET